MISFCPAEIIDEEREREQIKIPEEKRPGKGREREKEGGEREKQEMDGRWENFIRGMMIEGQFTPSSENGLAIDIEDLPSLPSELRSPC